MIGSFRCGDSDGFDLSLPLGKRRPSNWPSPRFAKRLPARGRRQVIEEDTMITIRPAPVRGRGGRLGIRHEVPAMFLALVAAPSAWGQGPRQVVSTPETKGP